MKLKIYIFVVITLSFLLTVGGCASYAVSEDALVKNTSFALGLEADKFTIANRADNGITTNYTVQTVSGAQYKCYVQGAISLTGKNVSDAICRRVDANGIDQNKEKPECNELLSAAGQC